MLKIITAVVVLATSQAAFAHAEPFKLEGRYECGGKEIDTHTDFKCNMMIEKTGGTYRTKSHCDDGTIYLGTGIYFPETHHLSLVFINPKRAAETGVVAAEVKPDGSMTSTFTYINKTSIEHGYCVRAKTYAQHDTPH